MSSVAVSLGTLAENNALTCLYPKKSAYFLFFHFPNHAYIYFTVPTCVLKVPIYLLQIAYICAKSDYKSVVARTILANCYKTFLQCAGFNCKCNANRTACAHWFLVATIYTEWDAMGAYLFKV